MPQTLDWYRHPSRFQPVHKGLNGLMYFVSPTGPLLTYSAAHRVLDLGKRLLYSLRRHYNYVVSE